MQGKNIAITIALVIAFGAGGFYGGTIYEKSSLSKQGLLRGANNFSANANRQFSESNQSQGRPNGTSGASNRGGNMGNRGGNLVTGEISSKDDKSLTVKTQDGSLKIIFFSDSTTVGKSIQASSSDLNIGDQIMANGQSNPDGSIAAQNIQIRPAQ